MKIKCTLRIVCSILLVLFFAYKAREAAATSVASIGGSRVTAYNFQSLGSLWYLSGASDFGERVKADARAVQARAFAWAFAALCIVMVNGVIALCAWSRRTQRGLGLRVAAMAVVFLTGVLAARILAQWLAPGVTSMGNPQPLHWSAQQFLVDLRFWAPGIAGNLFFLVFGLYFKRESRAFSTAVVAIAGWGFVLLFLSGLHLNFALPSVRFGFALSAVLVFCALAWPLTAHGSLRKGLGRAGAVAIPALLFLALLALDTFWLYGKLPQSISGDKLKGWNIDVLLWDFNMVVHLFPLLFTWLLFRLLTFRESGVFQRAVTWYVVLTVASLVMTLLTFVCVDNDWFGPSIYYREHLELVRGLINEIPFAIFSCTLVFLGRDATAKPTTSR